MGKLVVTRETRPIRFGISYNNSTEFWEYRLKDNPINWPSYFSSDNQWNIGLRLLWGWVS
jgi:hypothetical protein